MTANGRSEGRDWQSADIAGARCIPRTWPGPSSSRGHGRDPAHPADIAGARYIPRGGQGTGELASHLGRQRSSMADTARTGRTTGPPPCPSASSLPLPGHPCSAACPPGFRSAPWFPVPGGVCKSCLRGPEMRMRAVPVAGAGAEAASGRSANLRGTPTFGNSGKPWPGSASSGLPWPGSPCPGLRHAGLPCQHAHGRISVGRGPTWCAPWCSPPGARSGCALPGTRLRMRAA